ncbi:MAG TPA: glutathione S-transferase family protein [Stellaceae bacterium]|nr:glutathione S-transferase family protein [Stellaceae bacterium]
MTITLFDLAGAEPDRRFSPYCWRTRLALAHKRLPVETLPWRFTEKERIAPSGQGRVPVIIDADKWIADSWAIANYLEDTYPDRASLFGGEGGRALARFFNSWVDAVLQPIAVRLVVLDIWQHVDERDKAYFRKSREERFGMPLEQVQADRDQRVKELWQALTPARMTLERQKFLGGDTPLYPDYILAGMFLWTRGVSEFPLLESGDPIAAWRERMLDLYGGLARRAKAYAV